VRRAEAPPASASLEKKKEEKEEKKEKKRKEKRKEKKRMRKDLLGRMPSQILNTQATRTRRIMQP